MGHIDPFGAPRVRSDSWDDPNFAQAAGNDGKTALLPERGILLRSNLPQPEKGAFWAGLILFCFPVLSAQGTRRVDR